MSFKESIIIPLETFNRCQLATKDKTRDIIADTSLPSDTKLKLLGHEENLIKLKKRKVKITPNIPTVSKSPDDKKKNKLQLPLIHFSVEDRPLVQAILDVLEHQSNDITWDANTQTVIIDGTPIPNSNIVKIFQYLFKIFPSTRTKDIPLGTREVYDKLTKFKIPNKWIKRKPPQKRSARKIQKPLRYRDDSPVDDQPIDDETILTPTLTSTNRRKSKKQKDLPFIYSPIPSSKKKKRRSKRRWEEVSEEDTSFDGKGSTTLHTPETRLQWEPYET